MKRINALVALSIGVIASSSGMIQAQAATFNFNVDFSTKEVANFNNFKQTFNTDTYDLSAEALFSWDGFYRFDSCPTAFTLNMSWNIRYRLNGIGSFIQLNSSPLPDFLCTTIPTLFTAQTTTTLPGTLIDALINDDANFVEFQSRITTNNNIAVANRTLYLSDYNIFFEIKYNFDTTYLFNYFLSDQNYVGRNAGSLTASYNATQTNYLVYLFTTAGNDFYYLRNTNLSTIGTTRKKYAVDYNQEFFRGNSIGAGFESTFRDNDDSFIFNSTGLGGSINFQYNYYYLNAANAAQAIVNVPQITFTNQTCSGGFLDINVGCYVNNALAWLTNDAPIISDLTTIVNTGIEFAGQTFGVIGNFTTSNMFGYLILGGFGFIAVKWLFKDDK
jgi:hypothetical protein